MLFRPSGLKACCFVVSMKDFLSVKIFQNFCRQIFFIRELAVNNYSISSFCFGERLSHTSQGKKFLLHSSCNLNKFLFEDEEVQITFNPSMLKCVIENYAVAFFAPLMQLMMNLTMVIILWLGAQEVQQQIVTLGGLMVFIQYVLMFMSALGLVSALLMAYPQAAVSASRVKEVLDCDFSIQDKENPVILENIAGRIEFRAVSFGYSGAEINVLERLDFVAEPGKITAIVGATGSGKTTLVNLIMRLYEVSSGAIVIDGVDIRDLTQHDLRSIIAYAPQESVLFSGTVLENIRVGKDQATEAEVIEALSIAQALDFINEREGQVASTISQGGKDLSGGQRQRLSIARAAVKKAPITIFDDCFSALDFKTDSLVRKAIREKFGDKTVLIVAQRISTIKHADQILVLDNGAIVGQGKHEDLIRDCRVYQEILKSQSYSDGKEESL